MLCSIQNAEDADDNERTGSFIWKYFKIVILLSLGTIHLELLLIFLVELFSSDHKCCDVFVDNE